MAQASVREAINILAQQGFVTKQSGHSARVVHFSEQDVLQIYEMRGALEGLAARLAAQNRADLSLLQTAVNGMRSAEVAGDRDALLCHDRDFHLHLCEIAANPILLEHARRILLPLFAFVRMRVEASQQDTSAWSGDLEAHQRIIDLIRDGEAEVAEHYLHRAMERFAKTAYDNWEKRDTHGRRSGK